MVRRLNVGDEPPFEARPQTILEDRHGAWRTIAGQNDLAARLMNAVERVEKLFLRTLLARDELHVVDQQHARMPVLEAEVVGTMLANGLDQLVGERFGRDVHDVGAMGRHGVADSVEQVRFAQPDSAVQKQRVVRVARMIDDCQRRRVRKSIGLADDEVGGELNDDARPPRAEPRGR